MKQFSNEIILAIYFIPQHKQLSRLLSTVTHTGRVSIFRQNGHHNHGLIG
jgi:hypothetical protein